jgi:hypothetical protein
MGEINKLLTHTFTIDIFPHVLETWYFAGLIHEIHGNMIKRHNLEKRKAKKCKRIKAESPPTCQTWVEHRHGSHPGPTRRPSEPLLPLVFFLYFSSIWS